MFCKFVKILGVGEIVWVDVYVDFYCGCFFGKDCIFWGVRVKVGVFFGLGCVGVVEEGFVVVCYLVVGRVDY